MTSLGESARHLARIPGRPLAEFLAQAITVDHPFLFFPVTFCVGEGAAEGRGGVGDVTRAANRTGYRLVEEKATECVGGGREGVKGTFMFHSTFEVRGCLISPLLRISKLL